ncbi:MAG: fatty acid hydroxylase, partial [Burkholderiales bacterium PBB5]
LSHSPWAANLQVYVQLWAQARATPAWADRLRLWCKPPGWESPAWPAHRRKPPFQLAQLVRHQPVPAAPGAQVAAVLLFVLLVGAEMLLLWHAHRCPAWLLWGASAGLLAGLCAVAALGRPGFVSAQQAHPA